MVAVLLFAAAVQHYWAYLPPPLIPADNPITEAKVSLGQRLFHEQKLSVTGAYSCASCHQPERHFTDGLAQSVGALGDRLPHNTPTLYFSAYNASLGWLDNAPQSLEQQHLIPLQNNTPIELGYEPSRLALLEADASYRHAFAAAFDNGAITTGNLIKALASYVRTLIPPPTAFDRYVFEDDREALSTQARQGMTLFFSTRLGCAQCHASLTLSGPIRHQRQSAEPVFHVMRVSGSSDAFRAPTLRHIRHTAPYMHDGSLANLEQVVRHYQSRPSERVPAFSLTSSEQAALIAFLHTL